MGATARSDRKSRTVLRAIWAMTDTIAGKPLCRGPECANVTRPAAWRRRSSRIWLRRAAWLDGYPLSVGWSGRTTIRSGCASSRINVGSGLDLPRWHPPLVARTGFARTNVQVVHWHQVSALARHAARAEKHAKVLLGHSPLVAHRAILATACGLPSAGHPRSHCSTEANRRGRGWRAATLRCATTHLAGSRCGRSTRAATTVVKWPGGERSGRRRERRLKRPTQRRRRSRGRGGWTSAG